MNRAIESPASINNRLSQQQQQHYDSSVTELRRKLARKASTFSLRSKSRRSQRYLRDLIKAEEESETSSVVTVTQEGSRSKQVDKEVKKSSATLPESGKFETVISHTRPPQQRREQHTSISMSSDISPPPVPFSRLQKIATQACNTTLESASSYVHASTAEWNTTIINSILQRLVKETTPEAGSQPQYKYIVNSTIIQHAVGADGGRRGMHAASGAYWNNEKDGMWSFKYEAAEGKGLDVVVGIIWVWIG